MKYFSFWIIAVFLAWPAAKGEGTGVLFADDFEAGSEGAKSFPTAGTYANFKAVVTPLSTDAVGTAASGRVLQLERSEQMGSGPRRVIARLDRPVQTGERLRLEFDSRLESGKAMLFGLGSSAGGIAMGEGSFYSVVVSLSADGRVAVFNGANYVRVPDLTVTPGQWQRCVLEFTVGTDEIQLWVGAEKAMVAGPFAEQVSPLPSVEEIFFSAASAEVTGEFDNVKVTVVENAGVSALPVFGRIVWRRDRMPFVSEGPKGGISGVGMCALGDRVFVAGGFLGKGGVGDGSTEPNSMTSKWVYAFDTDSKQWERMPDLPGRAEYGRLTAADGKLYFVGGASYVNDGDKVGAYTPSAAVHVLDPSAESPAWTALSALPEPRTHFALGAIGKQLVAMGGNVYDVKERGYSPKTVRSETAVLNLETPEEGWEVRKAAPHPARGWAAAAACGGKLWVFGGLSFQKQGSKNGTGRLRSTMSYDPATDTWASHTPAPVEISGWAGVAYRDRYVILVGGYGGRAGTKARMNVTPLVYDTVEDRWLQLAGSVTPTGGDFNDPGLALCNDYIYVAGAEGYSGSHYNHWLTGRIEQAQ